MVYYICKHDFKTYYRFVNDFMIFCSIVFVWQRFLRSCKLFGRVLYQWLTRCDFTILKSVQKIFAIQPKKGIQLCAEL